MTKADAIPQGTNKLSPSDRIPSSEQAGPDVGLGEGGRGGGLQGEPEGKGDRDTGRKWRTCDVAERRNNGAKKRKRECGFCERAEENS